MLSIAYRMVGSFSEAEDLVQEAFLRLARGRDDVESPKAWLTTVTTRLASTTCARRACGASSTRAPGCRSRCSPTRRRTPPCRAETLSLARAGAAREPVAGRARGVRAARGVRLRLRRDRRDRRQERGRTAARSRSARAATSTSGGRASSPRASSARSSRGASSPRCQEGETEPLVELLAADAAFYGDGGGKAPAIGTPMVRGASGSRAAGRLRAARPRDGRDRRAGRGQRPARHARATGRRPLVAAMAFEISGGGIRAIRGSSNPDKLHHVSTR